MASSLPAESDEIVSDVMTDTLVVSRETRSLKQRRASRQNGIKGRGAVSNPKARLDHEHRINDDLAHSELPKRSVLIERPRKIISKNTSPDIPFDKSINPYRGCEHGCVYCYARPTHAYMNLSSGLDFETQLFAKPNAAELLRQQFSKSSYKVEPIAIGTNTDPYQPLEKDLRIMRSLLEVFVECRHPVTITTKSALVLRDLDLLQELAKHDLVHVTISVTTLDRHLANIMEPRASTPQKRLDTISELKAAGIPVGMSISPVIPIINDHEMEALLAAGKDHGADTAYYIIIRLPHDVKQLFQEWLATHFPERARHVMSIIRSMHEEKEYKSEFGTRMRGSGPYAKMLKMRFDAACGRLKLRRRQLSLNSKVFKRPVIDSDQFDLFAA